MPGIVAVQGSGGNGGEMRGLAYRVSFFASAVERFQAQHDDDAHERNEPQNASGRIDVPDHIRRTGVSHRREQSSDPRKHYREDWQAEDERQQGFQGGLQVHCWAIKVQGECQRSPRNRQSRRSAVFSGLGSVTVNMRNCGQNLAFALP